MLFRNGPAHEGTTAWIDACRVDEIDREDVMRLDHDGRSFAVYRAVDGLFYCTDGMCTHEHVRLADDLLMDFEIECPRHNGLFDYGTGRAKLRPSASTCRATLRTSKAAA